MSRFGHNLMTVNGLSIAVHQPLANPNRGTRLAPQDLHRTHMVADYEGVPDGWPRAGKDEGSFFLGVSPDRECWFDFRELNRHAHHVAVVVSVQRINAVSGRLVDDIQLEQYVNNCPKHDVPFEADRFCKECGYMWPAQNYVCNAAGRDSEQQFWIDGWRSQEGQIRQFVFTDVEAGLGVAQQLIGTERSVAIGFAIYLSKQPKPVVSQPERTRRGGSPPPCEMKLMAAAPTLGGGGAFESFDYDSHSTRGFADIGEIERGPTRSLDETAFLSSIGTPAKQEVSYGRAVKQQVHKDPHELDFWQPTPAAVIMLTPAPEEWVKTLTRNGTTVDRTKEGLGFLHGLDGKKLHG